MVSKVIDEVKYLPFSGRRYMVNIFGDLMNAEGEIIKPAIDEGRKVYVLDWVLGRTKYEIGLLMLVAFNRLGLESHLWSEITIDYKDGNRDNAHLVNLSYHFTLGALEVEHLPGYFYVPFFTRYAINEDGTLINIEKGNQKSWAVTKPCRKRNSQGGYRYTRVLNDFGQTKCLFRHRALCLTFKDYGEDPDILVVNHIDDIPENDTLDNLEWTTYSDNNFHAYKAGLRPNSCTPVLAKNLETGEEMKFETLTSCARYLGYDRGEVIRRRILRGTERVYSDNLAFKFDDGKPWPKVDDDKTYTENGGVAVVARNVFSGKVYVFNNASECAKFIGETMSNVYTHINREDILPVNGYVCRTMKAGINWPKYTQRHLKIFRKYPKKTPNGVILLNRNTGEELFFESAIEAGDYLGVSRRHILYLIREGRSYKDQYDVSSFDIKKQLKSLCGDNLQSKPL